METASAGEVPCRAVLFRRADGELIDAFGAVRVSPDGEMNGDGKFSEELVFNGSLSKRSCVFTGSYGAVLFPERPALTVPSGWRGDLYGSSDAFPAVVPEGTRFVRGKLLDDCVKPDGTPVLIAERAVVSLGETENWMRFQGFAAGFSVGGGKLYVARIAHFLNPNGSFRVEFTASPNRLRAELFPLADDWDGVFEKTDRPDFWSAVAEIEEFDEPLAMPPGDYGECVGCRDLLGMLKQR